MALALARERLANELATTFRARHRVPMDVPAIIAAEVAKQYVDIYVMVMLLTRT